VDKNRLTYETGSVVRAYAGKTELQAPERRVLDELGDRLKVSRMLDIGVGGGRTTRHFAPRVAEYIGIDYSEAMIEACIGQYPPGRGSPQFRVCDVRSMSCFENDSFDFILFSFNGLDSLSAPDRADALREIGRVGSADGRLLFSSHNLGGIDGLFRLRWMFNPVRLAKELVRKTLLRIDNERPAELKSRPTAVVNDGVHAFRLQTFYTQPAAQVRQLEGLGFSDVRVLSCETGESIEAVADGALPSDPWLYYLCRM
jgi:SAM-dependent methyltransferase